MRRRRAPDTLARKLGASYMRVIVLAVVVLEVVALFAVTQGVLYARRSAQREVAAELAPVAADLLAAGARPEALDAYLSRPVRLRDGATPLAAGLPHIPNGYAVVVDASGTVWFDNRLPSAAPPTIARSDAALLARARTGLSDAVRIGLTRTALASPLKAVDGDVVGALLQVSTLLPAQPGLLALTVGTVPVAALLAGLIGTSVGLRTSRPLARRIEALAAAADAWSEGDFRRTVHDPRTDELGRLARRMDRMATELDELMRARQAVATANERARLAGELHDSVKQQIFAASMLLGAARGGLAPEAAGQLDAAADLIEEAKRELSDLIQALRPAAVEGRTLDDALRGLAASHTVSHGPAVETHLARSPPTSPTTDATLYRIAQEALANAERHADARRIEMTTRREGDEVVLSVADDGRGFDPTRPDPRGFGLRSMRQRAEAAGGHLRIESAPGRGTHVVATVPLRAGPPVSTPSRDAASDASSDPHTDARSDTRSSA